MYTTVILAVPAPAKLSKKAQKAAALKEMRQRDVYYPMVADSVMMAAVEAEAAAALRLASAVAAAGVLTRGVLATVYAGRKVHIRPYITPYLAPI